MQSLKIPCLMLVVGLAGSVASGQVVPPPPAEEPKQPEYTPDQHPLPQAGAAG